MGGYALPAEVEERQVVRSCLAGEDDGFDLLYRRYAPALVAFCERRLGTVGDAEDAAHETILKAHRALPRFREGARLWPWLATIAANVCTDIQRSRERFESGDDEALASSLLAPEVDEDVSRRLRASIVDAALDELPERFRTPLFLREFMGWSYEEIAEFSNKSIGSVRTTLMRSRRAFQSRVEDVARRRGQWPLPAVVVGGWRRLRSTLRSWRESATRAGGDAASAMWRAEGLLGGLGSGLQAAAVAVVAAGTMMGPSVASASEGVGVSAPTPPAEVANVLSDSRPEPPAAGPDSGSGSVPKVTAKMVDVDQRTDSGTPVAGATLSSSRDDTGAELNAGVSGDPTGTGQTNIGQDTYVPCQAPTWSTVCEVGETTGVIPPS